MFVENHDAAPDFRSASGWRGWIAETDPGSPAALASILAHVPGVHMGWDCWSLDLCHLRRVDSLPDAHLSFPTATHEITFWALDPDVDHGPRLLRRARLTPEDFRVQVELPTDAAALALFRRIADVMFGRGVPPDSDWCAEWSNIVAGLLSGDGAAPT